MQDHTLISALRAEVQRARLDAGYDSVNDMRAALGLPTKDRSTAHYKFERGSTGWGPTIELIVWQYAQATEGTDAEITPAVIWRRAIDRWDAELRKMEAAGKAEARLEEARASHHSEKKSARKPAAKRRK